MSRSRTDPSLFAVTVERADGMARVIAVGELDIASVPQLDAAIHEQQASSDTVIVDLRELKFMDSTGLRCLLRARERAIPGRLVLVRGPETVQRVFEMTQTDELLQFVDDPADARGQR